MTEDELGDDAACRPHVDGLGVVRRAQCELGCAVEARADVRHGWLARDERLGRAKVAHLEDAAARVDEQVLWFDVAVRDPRGVHAGEAAAELVGV